jgi:hypothetical protein
MVQGCKTQAVPSDLWPMPDQMLDHSQRSRYGRSGGYLSRTPLVPRHSQLRPDDQGRQRRTAVDRNNKAIGD